LCQQWKGPPKSVVLKLSALLYADFIFISVVWGLERYLLDTFG